MNSDSHPKTATGSDGQDSVPIALEDEARDLWQPRSDEGSRWKPGKPVAGCYRVVSRLARGGMAEVYLLHDTRTGDFIAAKRPLASFLRERALRERFISEATSWTGLPYHPNIVSAFSAGEVDYYPCILIEYVDGGTVAGLLGFSPGGLPLGQTLKIAIQVCWAMELAHERQLVHRDLKPSNIMLTRSGDAKVTDFGLATLAGAQRSTRGEVAGTWGYMAPELWEGVVSPLADVYAFGVTLYVMLTGQHPVLGRVPAQVQGDPHACRDLHCSVHPIDPISLNPAITKDLRDIVLDCLSKDPNHRPKAFSAIANMMTDAHEHCAPGFSPRKPSATELDRCRRAKHAWGLLRIGDGARTRGDVDAALAQYLEAEPIFSSLQDWLGLSACYNLVGSVYHDRGHLDHALTFYTMALDILRGEGASPSLAAAWLGIGNVRRERGEYDEAMASLIEGHSVFDQLCDESGMARCIRSQGVLLMGMGHVEEALLRLEEAVHTYTGLGDEYETANSRVCLATALVRIGENRKALELLQMALRVLEKVGGRHGAALCHMSIGDAESALGHVGEAIREYTRSAEELETLGYSRHLAECLVCIGDAHYSLSHYPEAFTAYSRAAALEQEMGRPSGCHIAERIQLLQQTLQDSTGPGNEQLESGRATQRGDAAGILPK